jgi:hypothetical protein
MQQGEIHMAVCNRAVFLILWSVFFFMAATNVWALEVSEVVITTDIIDRSPVDAIESYSSDVGKIYCFTRIEGALEETSVSHVWYYEDEEMARITLPVRSSYWRTWSSKNILPAWTGDWRVEILNEDGVRIKSISFNLF